MPTSRVVLKHMSDYRAEAGLGGLIWKGETSFNIEISMTGSLGNVVFFFNVCMYVLVCLSALSLFVCVHAWMWVCTLKAAPTAKEMAQSIYT